MILIVTHKEDFTADFIIDKLNRSNTPYVRLNCEDIDLGSYNFRFGTNYVFDLLNSQKFDSVWFRRVKLPEMPSETLASERQHLLSDYYSLIQNILLSLDAKWLSHPTNVYAAENKMLQLKTAVHIGFTIPETIITNDKNLLTAFYKSKEGDVIIKPINSNRIVTRENQKLIFTNRLPKEFITNLSGYDLTPAIYQEYIPKEYEVRVTVVDEKVFSARVLSQDYETAKVDWRRERIPFHSYELPKDLKHKCVRLTKSLGLNFGAIDLIKGQDGDYHFLEINPNGQWVWIETDTGVNISDAIINFLK